MKKIALVIFLFLSAVCAFAEKNPLFVFSGESYMQRGILTFDNREIAFTVYVKTSSDKIKLVMDTPAGSLAWVELDHFGNLIRSEGGKFFPKRFVESFVLPNFRAIMGFTKFLDSPLMYIKNGRACEINYGETVIKFEDLTDLELLKTLPRIEIISPKYKLEFNYIASIC